MAEAQGMGGVIQGRVTSVGDEGKSGGKFVVLSTGKDLFKIFVPKDIVPKIPAPFEMWRVQLRSQGDGFISAAV